MAKLDVKINESVTERLTGVSSLSGALLTALWVFGGEGLCFLALVAVMRGSSGKEEPIAVQLARCFFIKLFL